jgi:putative N6-adenine-specific DNA methylase
MFNQRGKRPDSGPNRDQAVVYLYWVNSDCYLYFDTSGETISKHGYRRIPFKAPLRESLAAALIKATRWKPGMPLANPMAGSGTLAIEAAMIALNIAPGLKRENFGFMHLQTYQRDEWLSLVEDARKLINQDISGKIIVNDSSLEALWAAKKNAEWADVLPFLDFHHGDFSQVAIPEQPGVVIFNPEYGARLGEVEQLSGVYKKIGDFFKLNCVGYWGYIFSGNPELSKHIGLRTSRKVPFYNGKIECRLLEYELYAGTKKNG